MATDALMQVKRRLARRRRDPPPRRIARLSTGYGEKGAPDETISQKPYHNATGAEHAFRPERASLRPLLPAQLCELVRGGVALGADIVDDRAADLERAFQEPGSVVGSLPGAARNRVDVGWPVFHSVGFGAS